MAIQEPRVHTIIKSFPTSIDSYQRVAHGNSVEDQISSGSFQIKSISDRTSLDQFRPVQIRSGLLSVLSGSDIS